MFSFTFSALIGRDIFKTDKMNISKIGDPVCDLLLNAKFR